MDFRSISFAKNNNEEFYKVLKQRVNQYFKNKNITRYGNAKMVVKTILLMSLYFVPFIFLITLVDSFWVSFLMWILMGFGMAGCGLSIMHDANHGAYSKNDKVNKFVGLIMVFLGGSDVNWRIQHNVLHHTYTNVTGIDEDIDPGMIMRFSPHQKRRWAHRFQYIYAWFFYGLMTLMWFVVKDYKQSIRYKKMGLMETQQITFKKHMLRLVAFKVVYAFVTLGLPLWLNPTSWYWTILFFLAMHFVAGLTLAAIFQPAHVVPSSEYPMPDASGNIDADWAVNQLYNTTNFAPNAPLFSWFVGGLNFQVEHHLFPNICHVHYKELSKIVKTTAEEFNLPYHSYKTFFRALGEHTKMLYNLGKYDNAPAIH